MSNDRLGAFVERHPAISDIDDAVIKQRRRNRCCVACGRKLVLSPGHQWMCPTDLQSTGHES